MRPAANAIPLYEVALEVARPPAPLSFRQALAVEIALLERERSWLRETLAAGRAAREAVA